VSDQRDQEEARYEEYIRLFHRVILPRIKRAEKAYAQALTSLWIGNGAAALATLSFLGASSHQGQASRQLLWPLWFFVLGLVSMGIGTFASIVREARSARSMLKANASSILDVKAGDLRGPIETAGLTFDDWRTRMACLAALFFIGGCAAGLFILTRQW